MAENASTSTAIKFSTPRDANMTRPLPWPDNIRKTLGGFSTSDAIHCPHRVLTEIILGKVTQGPGRAANRALIEFLSSSLLLEAKCNICVLPALFSPL
jgi:hypothetical protein